MRLEDYDQAIIDLEKAIGLDANYTDAYLNRGIVLYQLRQYSEAIEDYGQVLLLDPERIEAYAHLARAYTMIEDQDKVMENIQQLIDKGVDVTELSSELLNLSESQ